MHTPNKWMERVAGRVFPSPVFRLLTRRHRRPQPVRWGSMRRITPVARDFFERGSPVDRYYIERFLDENKSDIRMRVLEVADPGYTRRYGGDRVTRSDVLHVQPGISGTTILGDLATGEGIPEDAFDCIILTQVLPFIYDVGSAIANSYRALRPEGVLLATAPGISQICRQEYELFGDYWRFTTLSMRRLFGGVFGEPHVEVRAYGNVLAAMAFLNNLATHELRRDELDHHDPDYELIITVRAVKRGDVQ